jgi:hypothetical protein
MFSGIDLSEVLDPTAYIGLAPQQVDAFVQEVAQSVIDRYRAFAAGRPADLRV